MYVRAIIENAGIVPPTHEELSKLSGLNKCTLKRGFRLMFGVSPHQYYVQRKMEKVKQLLLETKDDIWSIAYEPGYSQPSSFGNDFRKAMGITPLQFRNADKIK